MILMLLPVGSFRKRHIHEAIYILMRIYEHQPDVSGNYRLAAYYVYQQNL
jgi:hypothetical protein